MRRCAFVCTACLAVCLARATILEGTWSDQATVPEATITASASRYSAAPELRFTHSAAPALLGSVHAAAATCRAEGGGVAAQRWNAARDVVVPASAVVVQGASIVLPLAVLPAPLGLEAPLPVRCGPVLARTAAAPAPLPPSWTPGDALPDGWAPPTAAGDTLAQSYLTFTVVPSPPHVSLVFRRPGRFGHYTAVTAGLTRNPDDADLKEAAVRRDGLEFGVVLHHTRWAVDAAAAVADALGCTPAPCHRRLRGDTGGPSDLEAGPVVPAAPIVTAADVTVAGAGLAWVAVNATELYRRGFDLVPARPGAATLYTVALRFETGVERLQDLNHAAARLVLRASPAPAPMVRLSQWSATHRYYAALEFGAPLVVREGCLNGVAESDPTCPTHLVLSMIAMRSGPRFVDYVRDPAAVLRDAVSVVNGSWSDVECHTPLCFFEPSTLGSSDPTALGVAFKHRPGFDVAETLWLRFDVTATLVDTAEPPRSPPLLWAVEPSPGALLLTDAEDRPPSRFVAAFVLDASLPTEHTVFLTLRGETLADAVVEVTLECDGCGAEVVGAERVSPTQARLTVAVPPLLPSAVAEIVLRVPGQLLASGLDSQPATLWVSTTQVLSRPFAAAPVLSRSKLLVAVALASPLTAAALDTNTCEQWLSDAAGAAASVRVVSAVDCGERCSGAVVSVEVPGGAAAAALGPACFPAVSAELQEHRAVDMESV